MTDYETNPGHAPGEVPAAGIIYDALETDE
jgi:hypothetical protein